VNPGLPIARELVRRGHDVRWYSTPRFKNAIEKIGARFVPVVIFGKTEEKPEIANRLTWSGAGLGVKVLIPTEAQIRDAVKSALDHSGYRARAAELSKELQGHEGAREAARLIEERMR